MKAFGVLVLVLLLSLLSTVRAAPLITTDLTLPVCPVVSEKETELDCPWAGIARDLEATLKTDPNPETAQIRVLDRLTEIAPDYLDRLSHEGKTSGAMKLLWGRSINFDEGAKGIIVPNAVLDAVLARAGVLPRGAGVDSVNAERIAHAGFEHTYGYLLSNLKTTYGYKRLRWVRPDIENGFGLPTGTIAPLPKKGGLFSNVTYFSGSIAFRGDSRAEEAARKMMSTTKGVSRDLHAFNFKSLHGRRLTEVLKLDGGRTVEIRSDFVPFTTSVGDTTGGNAEFLIYSVLDSAEKLPYLITAFPISKGFSDSAVNPKGLGDNQTIITRYNAWIPGVTESKKTLSGTRSVSTF